MGRVRAATAVAAAAGLRAHRRTPLEAMAVLCSGVYLKRFVSALMELII